jgi:hypothetical protein
MATAVRRRQAVQTIADLAEIKTRVEERHAENQRRFDAIDARQEQMDKKLDLLIQGRSFLKGVWKTVTVIALVVSTCATFVWHWIRG